MGGVGVRPDGSRLQRDRSIGLGLILILIVALAVTVSAPAGSAPPASGPAAAASSGPGTTIAPGSTTAPTPTIPASAWEPIDVPGAGSGTGSGMAALLEPTRSGTGAVAVDTEFRLTSLDDRSPEALASGLVADPPISFTVVSTDGATALLRTEAPLRPRTGYRIALVRPDGTTEAMWAAVAAGPLTVTGTVPEDRAVRVPRDTGIEFTFDQYGVKASDVAKFFSIKPGVTGTFKEGGRTVAFAPDAPLAKGRLYTVTLQHGLPLAGTGQVLADDVVLRFETRSTDTPGATVAFRHSLADGNPREATAITVHVDAIRDGAKRPTTIPLTIHRLAGLAEAERAFEAIRDAPEWTLVTSTAAVSTKGLTRVFKGNVQVRKGQEGLRWIEVPRLKAGWYLLTERYPGTPDQLVLQVTDVATFALLAQGSSAFWVNDLATGGAAEGATLAMDGKRLGSTDGRGLLQAKTPVLLEGDEESMSRSIVVVRHGGRAAFLPLAQAWCGWSCGTEVADDWWHIFTTDRYDYRSTDTINAWGIVRDRDDGSVPASVTLTLATSDDSAEGEVSPTIATVTARPDANGAFIAAVPIADLPVGDYTLGLTSGETVLGEAWLTVRTIVKPAWQLAVSTDRHAVILGQPVQASVAATFFEGTPVAGTEVRMWVSSEDEDDESESATATVTTGAAGTATGRLTVSGMYEEDQWATARVSARPTLPEEGEIAGGADVMAFRAAAIVDAHAKVDGTRLTISGLVSDVALDRYEVPDVDLWDVEPRGDPRANPSVTVKVVQETDVRRQTGTRYDFILKRVVPEYDYSTKRSTILKDSITGGSDGRFRLATTVKGGDRSYVVTVSYTDDAGRRTTETTWATSARNDRPWEQGSWLEYADDDGSDGAYSIGDTVRVRFRGGGGDTADSRYLYAVAQRGLRYVTVGGSPTFRTTFDASWVPGVRIVGARFNGSGYEQVMDGPEVALRLEDRQIAVAMTPDRERYAPGETARVGIETRDAAGRPVSATVVVRVIDEKLFAMGAAEQMDTLSALYASVGSGIEAWASSHRTPFDDIPWGKGDTTGGGGDGRSEFRDWLVARLVQTGTDGRGSVQVPLSDDLTSWRVVGSAIDGDLESGDATVALPVGLPFFVEATIAPEYLAADRPMIRVRGFGSGLGPDDTVTFAVTSDSLPMRRSEASATAYTAAEIELPPLSLGTHRIRIEGTVGSGSTRRTDVLTRSFTVVSTRTSQTRTTWDALDARMPVEAGPGFTEIVLADAGRGRVVPLLESLLWTDGPRSDDLVAARLAGQVLRGTFGLADTPVLDSELLDPYARYGLALLPWSSSELDVTALAAMTGDRLLPGRLEERLRSVVYGDEEEGEEGGERRDRRLLALAGLAALDPAVLPEVREAAKLTDLTGAERISVALAALNAGDEALARELLATILAAHGQRYGDMVRIDVERVEDATVQTARLAIVAASLGDPAAVEMDRWVQANPSTLTSTSLERALAARGWATRVPGDPATAALTVDGTRSELRVESGQLARVVLTPAQAARGILEPVSGSVLVVQTRETALDPSTLTAPTGLRITRRVDPVGGIASDDTVVVTLAVTLPAGPSGESWHVVDLVPSGLAPIAPYRGYDDEGEYEDGGPGTQGPDRVDGQRVEFTVWRDPERPTSPVLRYVARVVTPGTYAWEPAVIQSSVAPDQGLALPAGTVTIAGLED